MLNRPVMTFRTIQRVYNYKVSTRSNTTSVERLLESIVTSGHDRQQQHRTFGILSSTLVQDCHENENRTRNVKHKGSSSRQHRQELKRDFGLYRHALKENFREPSNKELLMEEYKSIPPPDPSELKTADEMDFYESLTDDEYYKKDIHVEDELEREENVALRRQAVREEIDTRTGRLWTDPYEIPDLMWGQLRTLDDLPDWSPDMCSRVSLERVKLYPGGVPTIDGLAELPLPPQYPPHPALGDPYPYLKHKKSTNRKLVYDAVSKVAEPRIEAILSLSDWHDKQDGIDELFELVHTELCVKKSKGKDVGAVRIAGVKPQSKLDILVSQPDFAAMVEKGLEDYLRNINRMEKQYWKLGRGDAIENTGEDEEGQEFYGQSNSAQERERNEEATTKGELPPVIDDDVEPVFMDLLQAKGCILEEGGVPNLIHPLKPHSKDGPGRMIEEWELAANQETKRIMARQCMGDMARGLTDALGGKEGVKGGSRIYVKGVKGVGKTTTLAVIVASARLSGHIVLYLPDGDRLRKAGFYNEPNSLHPGQMFDLPLLTKEVCGQLLHCHGKDLVGMVALEDTLKMFLSKDKLRKLSKVLSEEGGNMGEGGGSISLTTLLKVGSETTSLAAGCYGVVIDTLMNQSDKPFMVVMDDFNCYFDHGHYFHEMYDPNVRNPIPIHKFTLFKPLLNAMGVEKSDDGIIRTKRAIPMKRGGIVVGITESHAVAKKFTTALTEAMESSGAQIIHVTQYSPLEVDHIIANFEVTGVGCLRFDQGSTIMNSQEVAYLRMVCGGIGQNLIDACIS